MKAPNEIVPDKGADACSEEFLQYRDRVFKNAEGFTYSIKGRQQTLASFCIDKETREGIVSDWKYDVEEYKKQTDSASIVSWSEGPVFTKLKVESDEPSQLSLALIMSLGYMVVV